LRLKIHILFILGLLLVTTSSLALDKFIRVKGVITDEISGEELSDYSIKIVEEDGSTSTIIVEKSSYDFWLRDNRSFKIYFIKDGYFLKHAFVDANFMPSSAYEVKHKLNFNAKMTLLKPDAVVKEIKRPIIDVRFIKKENAFETKDMMAKKIYMVAEDYEPPFPSPADTYTKVKPTNKRLPLTTEYNENRAKGVSGMPKVLQGVLFADMNYCFFNERTNDGNKILEKLKGFDGETWNSIKPIDSPEYGVIIARTINREQSVDTLFALGQHIETSRLILQNFTSDSKVLIHLMQLRTVLELFKSSGLSFEEDAFVAAMKPLIPTIKELENTYKDKLKNKLNFEIAEDPNFLSIKKTIEEVHAMVVK
jgi:hypothetical protein